jgi:hypothetical protein
MQMIPRFILTFFTLLGLSLACHAQQKDKAPLLQFRAVLHDPVHPIANLFYMDKAGTIVPLNFKPHDLTEALFTLPTDGSLVLYDKAHVDPENPAASLAASIKLPLNIKRAMILVLPSPEGKKPAYRMMIIDDSEKAFPKGESRVLPLIGVKTAVQAGEHKLVIDPGKFFRIPPVKKVDDYNMAQTNFYYQDGDSWIAFTERRLQFINACRRLFIVHATPGAISPTVTTIVDTSPVNSSP